jgi:lipoprotein-anchoring transpeptidase ErfK/SrfK
MFKTMIASALATALFLVAGCAKDVRVEYAAQYQTVNPPPPAIEVYVVGVDDANLAKFQQMSVDDFFAPGNANSLRQYAEDNHIGRSLTFSVDNPAPKAIAKDDPIWEAWKSSTHLVVVQNYPHTASGNPTAKSDSRYLELPLDPNKWNGQTLIISIGPTGPTCESGTH